MSAEDYDFLRELDDEWGDCFLSSEDMEHFTAPPTESWNDFPSDTNPAVFEIDASKAYQWELAKKEIRHLQKRMKQLFTRGEDTEVTNNDIMDFCIGPDSGVGEFLRRELEISQQDYLRFMNTFCVQSAYRVSSRELFRNDSLLKDSVLMDEAEYNALWHILANKKQVPPTSIRTSRHSKPLWESLETILNEMFADVSVNDREGRISIALDDDKIWFGSKVSGINLVMFICLSSPHLLIYAVRCISGQRELTRLIYSI